MMKVITVNLRSHKILQIFLFKEKLLPTHHGRPSTHFHLSGAHQTTSLYPAGNSCWCASISIPIPICFQVPPLPMSSSLSISPGGAYISRASLYSSPCFVSPDTFLKVRSLQGRKDGGRWKRGMKPYLQLVNSLITTWRTNVTVVKWILPWLSSTKIDARQHGWMVGSAGHSCDGVCVRIWVLIGLCVCLCISGLQFPSEGH